MARRFAVWMLGFAVLVCAAPVAAQQENRCKDVPSHAELQKALASAQGEDNGGLGFHMWATVVDRDGVVCAVVYTGQDRGDQWPGSRVISAQKASTANAFSLPKFALSTANLYSAVQPGGPLYGLQHSNPVNTAIAYDGPAARYGSDDDPLKNNKVGGVNVFGGGLALYTAGGQLVGALGVSGDTSCADHIIAWKTRHTLNLDNVPAGVADNARDNIIHDITTKSGSPASKGGYGHPTCSEASTKVAGGLVKSHPVGPER